MVSHLNVDPSHRSATSSSSTSTNPNSKFKVKVNRRRSLQTFFHIPSCATSKSFVCDDIGIDIDANPMKATTLVGSVLPHDTVLEIVELLSPADILSFSLTVRVFLFVLLLFISINFIYSRSPPTSVSSSFQHYTTQSFSNQVNTVA